MAFDVYNDKLCRVNDLFSSLTRQSKHTTSYYLNKWNVVRLTELLWEEWENSLFTCWDQFCMTIISCSGNPLVHNHSIRNTAEGGHTMCSDKLCKCQLMTVSSLLYCMHMHGTLKPEQTPSNTYTSSNIEFDSDTWWLWEWQLTWKWRRWE